MESFKVSIDQSLETLKHPNRFTIVVNGCTDNSPNRGIHARCVTPQKLKLQFSS
jgi:hypothetical protein